MRRTLLCAAAAGSAVLLAIVLSGCASDPEPLSPAEWIDQNSTLIGDLASYDSEKRYEAIARLQKEGRERGVAIALLLLRDPMFENYRAEVVLARFLAECHDKRAIPYLVGFLEHPDRSAAEIAAQGLSVFPHDPNVLRELSRMLESPQVDHRLLAAKTLRRVCGRNPSAVELCAERYRDEESREVRGEFLVAVSKSAHPRREEYLVEMLDDEDEALRQQAWWALRKSKDIPEVDFDARAGRAERALAIAALRVWAGKNRQ
jgi:hypothetical protein